VIFFSKITWNPKLNKGKVNACPLFGTGAMEKVTWMELDISVRIKPEAAGTVLC